jgi:hypothetical protein
MDLRSIHKNMKTYESVKRHYFDRLGDDLEGSIPDYLEERCDFEMSSMHTTMPSPFHSYQHH